MKNFRLRLVFSRFVLRTIGVIAVSVGACLLASDLQAQSIQPVVAIHDSELTRALATMPAVAPTPTGPGTTGFQWWPTNWNYFVMPEALQEMLRSDGTVTKVIRDSDVTSGLLLPNGTPKYPIVISLASEAIRDDEIAPLTNYVAAGGFLFVGGSSFTRNPSGTTRGDFAIANAMGLHVISSSLANWGLNLNITKQTSHRLVDHLPSGQLTWRMPAAAEEISWGVATSHPYLASHQVWRTQPSDATVLVQGDNYPYVTVKRYGNGYIIYCSAFQPMIAHGGFGPGMYAYALFRNAIEWASETAALPVVKLSPWPYQFDAAFVIRHDLENFATAISHIEASAQYEKGRGVVGDYYFCTGTLREDMAGTFDTNAVISSLQRAMSQDGATVASHNGGLKNPTVSLTKGDYDYWHWAPDEALDTQPAGYPNGRAYALASVSNSLSDIERWLPGLMTSSRRIWAAPYFNATREDSYAIQEQLGIKITGDQKLSPFPHWTVSTRTSGKRYTMLSQPVSDWYVGGLVAQSLEPWHPPGVQTSTTLHQAIDFYYGMGLFLNFYSHTLSTGEGDAGALVPDYIDYCMNASLHPRMWAANGFSIYDWWSRRATAQISVSNSVNGSQYTTAFSITGATDANTAVEFLAPSSNVLASIQVYRNGTLAPASGYRISGRLLKVPIGTTINNVQIVYSLGGAIANPDSYSTTQNTALIVPGPGVLANDPGAGGATAQLVAGPTHGTLNLNANGGFTYTPANGYSGTDSFTYQANSGGNLSGPAVVTITISVPGVLLSDSFTRTNISPWLQQAGTWTIVNNALVGSSPANSYGNAYYDASGWSDYAVSARISFSTNGYGGGIGGRLNPITGSHYAVWVYPETAPGGAGAMTLIKFSGWATWSGTPMQQVTLPSVGSAFHTIVLNMSGNNISVSYDGAALINVTDNNFDGAPAFTGGGISADMWTGSQAYSLAIDDVSVTSVVSGSGPSITGQPQSSTNVSGTTATFTVTANGTAPLNYQWRFNGSAIAGATGTGYSRTNVQSADAGNYTVLVSNSYGSVTSAVATLTVTAAPTSPSITSQPQSQTVTAGQSATFSVSASGAAPLNYQWRFNGNAIGSATGTSYTRTNAQSTDAGNYTVVVSNAFGSVTSSIATLTVNAAGVLLSDSFTRTNIAPWVQRAGTWTIVTNALVGAGLANDYANAYYDASSWTDYTVSARIRFTTNAYGGGIGGRLNPITGSHYAAWVYPETTPGGSSTMTLVKFSGWTTWSGTPMQQATLPGIGTATHTIALTMSGNNITASLDGVTLINVTDNNFDGVPPFTAGGISADLWTSATPYSMIVDDVSVTSPLTGTAPSITSQPQSQSVTAGQSATFSVGASGTAPLNYQWRFNGNAIAGANGTSYTRTNAQSADAGNYTVLVSNSYGSVTSSIATLTVTAVGTPPSITGQPQSQTVSAGQSATFSVGASGTAPLNYQWRFNGTAIGGATATSFTRTNAQSADAGNYTVIITNSFGSVTSAIATLTVNSNNVLFSDTFTRATIAPWIQRAGTWSITNNALIGTGLNNDYGNVYYNANWTNYTVSARIGFPTLGGYGGGIGGRLNPTTGAHYTAWVYSGDSTGGSPFIELVKFSGWTTWSGTPMQKVTLPSVGTTMHSVALTMNGNNISISFDGTTVISVTDNNYDGIPPFAGGGISADMYAFSLMVDDVSVTPPVGASGPSINTQPQSQTVTAGQSATFSVVALGAAPLSYQWRFNGNAIGGATGASYTRTNAQSATAGNYTVVVTNGFGSVTSAIATLTVNTPGTPPAINTQPQPQTVTAGQNATFSVGATGTAPLNYQWRFNGTAIGAATGTSYTRTNAQSADAGNYTVIVTNSFGSVTSTIATLTVISNSALYSDTFTRTSIAPWIQRAGTWSITNNALMGASPSDYGNAYYDASGWTDYTVSARIGFPTLSGYGGGIGGRVNPISGAHYSAWVYPGTSTPGSAFIELIKFSGWTTWNGTPMQKVTLPTVGTAMHTVALTMNGNNITISFDGTTVINVTDSNYDGIPPFTGGGISADMYANSLTIDDVSVASVGSSAPAIASQPQSRTNATGTVATFSVAATGAAPLNYQWRFNGSAISGATASGYSRTNVQSADAGNYSVVISNSFGSVTSAVATLTVALPPSVVTQPSSQIVTVGQSVTFSVIAGGTAPLSYQWQVGGNDIPGATGSSYTRTNAQLLDAGVYTVLVSSPYGSTQSLGATLTVNPAIAPTIVTQPSPQTVIAGQSASFSVVATGTAPLGYQWRLNGNNIANATNSSYTVSNAQVANAGSYSVRVSNDGGFVDSSSAALAVNYSLTLSVTANGGTINTSPAQSSYAPGTQVTLTAVPKSGYRFVSWQSGISGSANPATVTMNSNLSVQAKFQKN